MNVVNFNDRNCERYRRYFDAYLDNELLIETNQEVLQHLSSCAECTRILEARSRVKQSLRNAVKAETVPPELTAKLYSRLRARSGFFSPHVRWLVAVAAVIVLVIGGIRIVRWDRIRQFGGSGNALQTVSARARELLRVGLLDHIHCAIIAQQWKVFRSLDAMKAETGREALGPQFIDLVSAVESKLGTQYKLVQGHRCVVNGRQYIHFILTGNNAAILSLVITEKNNESFLNADAVAVMKASGISIYRDQQDAMEIAGFESDKYLAFVVSNLDRESNLNFASSVAPIVYDHLHRLEL